MPAFSNKNLKYQILGFVIANLAYVGLLAIVLWLIWVQDRFAISATLGLNYRGSWQSHIFGLLMFGLGLSPTLVMLVALINLFRKQDELQRLIQHEAITCAVIGSALFAMCNFALGIISDGYFHFNGLFPWFLLPPVFGVSWLSGHIVAQWRYSPPE